MGALELREKLIKQFNEFIQDESKFAALDGVIDAMSNTYKNAIKSTRGTL